MTDLSSIARLLSGEIVSANRVACPGPGHSPKDRSLHVTFKTDGDFIVHSFAGDPWQTCKEYVRRTLQLPEFSWRERQPCSTMAIARGQSITESDAARTARAMAIWDAAQLPQDSPVEAYLMSRGLSLGDLCNGHVIRFHKACPFKLDTGATAYLPAMVALFRDVITDKPKAIHRTALKTDGSSKSDLLGLGNPKKMIGPVKGTTIKFSPGCEVTRNLAIAEGIETALTVYCSNILPVWAMGSAGAIASLPALVRIEALTIYADADPAGLNAARRCAKAWADEGREATIIYPSEYGSDWNDVFRRVA